MLNAGVDANWYDPVTLQEMISNNSVFRSQQAPAPDTRTNERLEKDDEDSGL